MGKEIKIGLGVIGALLCVFGGVLFVRLKREQPRIAQATVAAAKTDGKAKLKPKAKPDGPGDRPQAGPSLGAGLDKSASRRTRRESAAASEVEDRYGRRPDGADAQPPKNFGPQAEAAPDHQLESPSTEESPYRLRPQDDRYARHQAETGQADPVAETAADGSEDAGAGDDTSGNDQQDVAMPLDRFASSGPAGLAFSPDDDETAPPAADEDAPDIATDEPDHRVADVPPSAGRYRDEGAMFGRAPATEELAEAADPPADAGGDAGPSSQGQVEGESYTVEPNDNFWRISQKVYGTGAYFKALEEYNRQQFGDRVVIDAGDVISTPSTAVLRREYPELAPKDPKSPAGRRNASSRRSYTVAEGDTLFDIARQELGKASRWSEIYELNRDQLGNDFNDLAPGMKLALPADGTRDNPIVTGPPRDRYRR